MKWEYKAIHFTSFVKTASLTEALNEFGQDGWELASSDLEQNFYVFKRPKITLTGIQEIAMEMDRRKGLGID